MHDPSTSANKERSANARANESVEKRQKRLADNRDRSANATIVPMSLWRSKRQKSEEVGLVVVYPSYARGQYPRSRGRFCMYCMLCCV